MSNSEPIRSLDEPFDAPPDPTRRRLLALAGATGVGVVGLAAHLWRLQVFSGSSYRELADNNRFRLGRLDPPRGVIYDRNEHPLARNRPSYVVAIVPADLPKPPDAVLRRLARLIGASPAELIALIKQRATDPFTPIPLRNGIDVKLAYVIEERHQDLPGVQILVKPVREYVDGRLASHVVGYVGRIDEEEFARLSGSPTSGYTIDDQIGKMGIELVRETDLRGRPGQKRAEVDSTGRELRVLGIDRAEPGRNLVLTLDMPLQREIARLLAEDLPRTEAASAVVLDPRNGQVLAQVHLPTYDNNLFSRDLTQAEFDTLLKDPGRPLVDGAIAGAYPPGSVFKIVTAVAGLQAGVVKPDTKIECTGALVLPDRLAPGGVVRIPCWARHGPQDCATALANSCNVFFYQVGGGDPKGAWEGLDIDRLADWAGRFGLGKSTGVELPNEAEGFVPTRSWKRRTYREDWFTGDTYNTAIGQGFVTATPLQAASLVATIANGGRVYRPQVVLKTTNEDGQVVGEYKPELVRDLTLDPAKLKVVQRGLRYSMLIGRTENGTSYTGTSWDSDLRDLAVAGKTGTAEFGQPDASGKVATHGWFVGYAPFDQPQLAVSVFLRRGRGAQEAARIARRIFAFYFGVSED